MFKREYKTLLAFFSWKLCRKKPLISNLHIYHHCSENLMRFWNLLIDCPGLVKNLKTWWKRGENLVNFQNLLTAWRKPWWISNTWWIPKTWWKPGEFIRFSPKQTKKRFTPPKLTKRSVCSFFWWNLCVLWWNGENPKPGENLMKTWWIFKIWWTPGYFQNLVKTWWICKTWWKLGECQNLAKTCWKPSEFTRFSPNKRKKRFAHWRILGKTLVAFHIRTSIGTTRVAFQN